MQSVTKRTAWQRLNDGTTPFVMGGYAICILYALVIVIPIYFVIVSAFKNNFQIFEAPLALPKFINLDNFFRVQQFAALDKAMKISLFVTLGSELLILLIAFPAAYAIARIRSRIGSLFEFIFSLGFLIPALAMLLPVFLTVVRAGLLNKPIALVLFYPATKLSISIILLASYLRTVPVELEESAKLDGASHLQMIWYIFFPLARPGVITVVVLNFIDIWNEYLFALVLMNTQNRTLQIALAALKSNEMQIDYGIVNAGVILALIPVFLVFIVFQEQIVKGIYAGSLKG